jgi:hypothetical protein
MVMVQAINDQDTVNRKTVCEVLLNALDNVLMMNEANFHICGRVSSQKTVTTGQPRTLMIFTRNLYILRKLLFGEV